MDFSFTPLIEVFILAFILNYLLSFLWDTRSMDLFLGLLSFLVLAFFSSWFNFPILQKMIYVITNVAIVSIVVLFQPELRTALSKFVSKRRRMNENFISQTFVDQLTQSVFHLASKHQGALIVLENQVSINDFTNQSIKLEANFSSELIQCIFAPTSPLHDGAVLIKNRKILAASAILPLADENHPSLKNKGTRHKAAVGASMATDALIIVVSEETGEVSIAREGVLTKDLKQDRFKAVVQSLFFTGQKEHVLPKKTFQFVEWLRQ